MSTEANCAADATLDGFVQQPSTLVTAVASTQGGSAFTSAYMLLRHRCVYYGLLPANMTCYLRQKAVCHPPPPPVGMIARGSW